MKRERVTGLEAIQDSMYEPTVRYCQKGIDRQAGFEELQPCPEYRAAQSQSA